MLSEFVLFTTLVNIARQGFPANFNFRGHRMDLALAIKSIEQKLRESHQRRVNRQEFIVSLERQIKELGVNIEDKRGEIQRDLELEKQLNLVLLEIGAGLEVK